MNPLKFSKKVLLFMAVLLLLFIAIMILLFWRFQAVPESLIYSFFGLFTGELGILGLIKKNDND